MADDSLAIAIAVEANYFAPILASFDIEARAPSDSTSLIDVTDFFEGDMPAISGLRPAQRRDYQVRSLDASRSFIDRVRSYPLNINVRRGPTPDLSRSDMRPLIRSQLVDLRDDIERAARRISHRVSTVHLADLLTRIDAILEAEGG